MSHTDLPIEQIRVPKENSSGLETRGSVQLARSVEYRGKDIVEWMKQTQHRRICIILDEISVHCEARARQRMLVISTLAAHPKYMSRHLVLQGLLKHRDV